MEALKNPQFSRRNLLTATIFILSVVYLSVWLWTLYISHQQVASQDTLSPVIFSPGSDSTEYRDLAKNLLANKTFGSPDGKPETFRVPGYPLFIAAMFSISGSYFGVTLAQVLLSIASAILLFLLVSKYFGSKKAAMISIISGLSISALIFSMVLMSDVLFAFLIILFFYLVFGRSKINFWLSGLAGLVLGYSALVRPISMFLVIFIVPFWIFLTYKKEGIKRSVIAGLIILAGFVLVVAPWVIRNHRVAGVYSISSLSAYNLFHYNLPEYKATKEGISADVAREYFENQLSPEARLDKYSLKYSAELSQISKAYLKEHFVSYVEFHLVKTLPFFFTSGLKSAIDLHNHLFASDQDITIVQENISSLVMHGKILSAFSALIKNPFTFLEQLFWLAVFVLLIYAVFRNRKNSFVWLCAFVILYFALLTGPVSNSRYRLPAEPFMVTLAVVGGVVLWKDLRVMYDKRKLIA